ncbi:DUF397 domain-containing protein [Streptomyces sp. Tue6028]|uniref:DUF397 domain-containing protein n=1 Tax=Streptomyces sp. Tue6028 TaxID=2036037 RepID=UPI003D73C726
MAEQVWRKSSRSTTGANCLEIAEDRVCIGISVRDSKDVAGPRLSFSVTSWEHFLCGIEAF